MNEGQVLRSLARDDSYRVIRVLADGPAGRTELVSVDGEAPAVRKRIPLALANAGAWATLMDINEPLLPTIESMYQLPDELVVIYAYVEGESLAELVKREGPLDAERAAAIVCDVCHAASVLHAHGIVHRDISPGNVIVAEDGAHLLDLGIARRHSADARHDTNTLGTWGFAAPEQYGFAQTDARSDVYSLGRLLGYLLTGVEPDDDAFEARLADAKLVPARFAEIIAYATAFEPSRRYQRADDLREALRIALSGPGRMSLDASVGVASYASDASAASTRQSAGEVHGVGMPPRQDEVPGTASEVRRFREVPATMLGGMILAWLALMLYVILVILVTYDALTIADPPWGFGEYGMSASTSAAALFIARDIYLAGTHRGIYEHEQRRGFLLTRRVVITVVLAIASMFLFALLNLVKIQG